MADDPFIHKPTSCFVSSSTYNYISIYIFLLNNLTQKYKLCKFYNLDQTCINNHFTFIRNKKYNHFTKTLTITLQLIIK